MKNYSEYDLDIDIELDMRQIRKEEEREQRYQDFIDDLDQGDDPMVFGNE